MFEVDKPRRFHYEPRFYDPEKEKWEALKKKYAIEQEKKEAMEQAADNGEEKDELAYFEKRVRDLDKEERNQSAKMTWKDLFRKREMPKFNYTPRFSGSATATASEASNAEVSSQDESLTEKYRQAKHQIKIRRRFDISDTDYMKPVSGTKIILYCFIVFLLITLIISF
ncbi:MAG: hypothetical protein MJZ77_07430 [Bacteroidales bacterium]|nr:hypothetical protein [Bacteroidales bacterium]